MAAESLLNENCIIYGSIALKVWTASAALNEFCTNNASNEKRTAIYFEFYLSSRSIHNILIIDWAIEKTL